MRILIADHYYTEFTQAIYGREPSLAKATYSQQRHRIDTELFGETVFEVAALRDLGHEAWDSLVNVQSLQTAWAEEHRVRLSRPWRFGVRRRRGWIPWPLRSDSRWIGEALLAQVRELKPDVVHIQAMDLLDPDLVAAVRRETRLVVGQVATDLPRGWGYDAYDLVVSSIPDLVDRFRQEGADAEWLPLAFEPSMVERIGRRERDVSVSFVGSFTSRYTDRIDVVEAVARVAPLQTWTANAAAIPEDSPIRPTIQGVAWGRDMYEVLARSRLAVNNHGTIARNAANNLRLFEATGMGALLVTDARQNLRDLFEVGEVVTYRHPRECAEVVRHYLDHPAEAAKVAAAGQARTLRDHTWRDRMERLVEMVEKRL